MPKASFRVDGEQKTIARLVNYGRKKGVNVSVILKNRGFMIERKAKDICQQVIYGSPPAKSGYKRTGRLLNSISTNWSGSGMERGKTGPKAKSGDGVSRPAGPAGMVVNVGSGVDYAIYNEFGTRKMSARPFLFPAYFSEEGEIIADLKAELKKDTSP
jgi:HK97 gp10 family phage protein